MGGSDISQPISSCPPHLHISEQDLERECQAWAKKYAVQGEEEAGQVGLWAAQLWAVSAHHRNVVEDLGEEIQVATTQGDIPCTIRGYSPQN